MNIEILKDILSIYKNKQSILYYYLPDKVKETINGCDLYDPATSQLFLNDTIYVINKSNLLLETSGKITSIDQDKIRLYVKYQYIIQINPSEYYIFVKKNRKTQRDFYTSILHNL